MVSNANLTSFHAFLVAFVVNVEPAISKVSSVTVSTVRPLNLSGYDLNPITVP